MKRTFTFISFFLFLASSTLAGPIDPEKALEIANDFWNNNLKKDAQLVLSPASIASKAPSRDGEKGSDAQYYIFNSNNDNGFVIISGDDRLTPVIGYSDNEPVGNMPQALKDWLEAYGNYVDDVRAGVTEPTINNVTATIPSIAPMLKTSWNQSAPYNNYCPTVNGQKTPTGCTATAMAQIMKYHEHPAKPKKAISWNNNITGKTETIDITKNTYDWTNMLPHYRNGYNSTQADAVATLMWDVGRAINSSYAPEGTGSTDVYAATALVNVFDYSPEIVVAKRAEYTYEEYIDLIIKNLQAKQPIMHTGHGPSYAAGHAFVCDGIDANGMLHIDWGWDAAYNGYFDMGSMSPGGSGIGGGQDRYNVGQSMIFNIRPRTADDADRNGDPTLYVYEVLNPKDDSYIEEYTAPYSLGKAEFKIVTNYLNWSHSKIEMFCGLGITSEDGTFQKLYINYGEEHKITLDKDRAAGKYYTLPVNVSNTFDQYYLKEGTYKVEIFYSYGGGDPKLMHGENACLTLVVGKDKATLSKAKPQIEVADLMFRKAPEYQLDAASFDVALRNTNKHNATVVVVPIVNQLNGDNVVKSDTLVNGIIMGILDNTDVIMTYNLPNSFKEAGTYNISFAYDFCNSYTSRETAVDKKKLKSISGASKTFEVKTLPDGPRPQVTKVDASNNVIGKNLGLIATVKNASAMASNYSSTIGLIMAKDDKVLLLASADVNLSQNQSAQLKFTSTDYYPALTPGVWGLYICEFKDNEWYIFEDGRYQITLVAPETAVLYSDKEIVVGYNNLTRPGDDADVKIALGCSFGDFDGYVRVNVTSGITSVLRSDYIPVTLKNGEITNINLKSVCGTKAPVGEWDIVIKYFNKSKRELGNVSKNTLYYPGNGRFMVDNVTAIDNMAGEGISVNADGNTIIIEGLDDNTETVIYTVDGKEIYRGTDRAIAVERGMYIIAVHTGGEKPYTTKVFVE